MAAVRSIIAIMPGVESTETLIVPPTSVSRRSLTVNSCSWAMPGSSDMRHASYMPAMYDDRHNRPTGKGSRHADDRSHRPRRGDRAGGARGAARRARRDAAPLGGRARHRVLQGELVDLLPRAAGRGAVRGR